MAEHDPNEPSWLNDGPSPSAGGGGAAAGSGYGTGGHAARSAGSDKRAQIVKWVFRIVDMGLCVMMAATAALAISYVGAENDVADLFVALYMLLFVGVFFTFEATQIAPDKCVPADNVLRRNFGFLYKNIGKAAFIIFIAFLNFGIDKPASLALATGVLLCADGIVQILVYLKWPELFDKDE